MYRYLPLLPRRYRAFESLFRQYHTTKGGLRYASSLPDSGGSGLSFLSKLWRGRKVQQEVTIGSGK